MIVNMLVALAVVVLPTITTFNEFVELDEVLYVCVLFWLLMAGPGKASLDHLLARRFAKSRVTAAPARISRPADRSAPCANRAGCCRWPRISSARPPPVLRDRRPSASPMPPPAAIPHRRAG